MTLTQVTKYVPPIEAKYKPLPASIEVLFEKDVGKLVSNKLPGRKHQSNFLLIVSLITSTDCKIVPWAILLYGVSLRICAPKQSNFVILIFVFRKLDSSRNNQRP